MIRFFFLICLTLFLLLHSCGEKTNRFNSRSIEESIESGFFIGDYTLEPIKGECSPIKGCWIERAWKFEYSIFKEPIKQERNFYNVFLKLGSENVKYREQLKKQWKNSSLIIEPDLGNYFQIISLKDSILIKVEDSSHKECIYWIPITAK